MEKDILKENIIDVSTAETFYQLPNFRYRLREVEHGKEYSFGNGIYKKLELMLQQEYQGSSGKTKWEWVDYQFIEPED